jgi:purine-cytosine permease-like protein
MVGTLSFGLGLRDAALIILFFGILCSIPPAYLSTLGPKTGLRQMIQARYSFGQASLLLPLSPTIANISPG